MRFGTEVLGQEIYTPGQQEVLESLVRFERTSVKSGHGVGKTNLAATATLWFKYAFTPSVVITTAPTERQVKQLLWREIRSRHRNAIQKLEGKPLTMSLELGPIDYALGFSTNDPNQIQGFHSIHILIIIDESNGFAEELFEPIEGLLSGGNMIRYLQLGNPIVASGSFFTSFGDGETNNITLSCLDHPNVITGKNIIPGAVTRKWVEKQRRGWGEDSAFWQSRVLGVFPTRAADIIVNLAWFETCELIKPNKKKKANRKNLYLGVDVGEYGDDPHVFYLGTPDRLVEIRTKNGEPREAIGITKQIIRQYDLDPSHVSIDGIGVGATVYSVLKEDFPKIKRFVASETAIDEESFANKGTEAWWNVRNLLNPESEIYNEYSLKGRKDRLKQDLCTRKYETNTKGQIMMEPKKAYRLRMKRSPDYGDAMAICYSFMSKAKIYGIKLLGDVF